MASSSLLNDPPKLGCWRTVCSVFYARCEKRALLGNGCPVPWADQDAAFLRHAMTGELFQTAHDWEDLQQRLRIFGYSDDLTLLKKSMVINPSDTGRATPPTETASARPTSTTAGCTTTTINRNKRSVMDCHENENHQDDQGIDVPDLDNVDTLMDRYRREPLRKRLRERILALRARRTNMRSSANQNLDSQGNVPLYRQPPGSAASPTTVVIPHDNHVHENRPIRGSWLLAALTRDGSDLRAAKRRKLASTLREFHATMSKSIHQDSFSGASFFHRTDAPVVAETSRAEGSPQQSGLATSTFTESTVNPCLQDAQSSAPLSVPQEPVYPFSIDVAKTGNERTSDRVKNQDILVGTTASSTPMNKITQDDNHDKLLDSQELPKVNTISPNRTPMNNITHDDNDDKLHDSQEFPKVNTTSPNPSTDQQTVVVGTAHIDEATGMTAPAEQKQGYTGKTLLVTESSPLQSQDQQEQSTSMTVGVEDTTTTTTSAAVVSHVPTPYNGHVRDIMISIAVWSISFHALLWILLGTDDGPTIHTVPGIKNDHAIRAYTNHHGPWLGQDQVGSSPSGIIMSKTGCMYLHHLYSPWYGLMISTLGVLVVSKWILSKLYKKIILA